MNTFYNFNSDRYYPWLLVCAIASAIGVVGWQVNISSELRSLGSFSILSPFVNSLATALTLLGLLTLACRIVFACRYVPYLPVDDTDLPFVTIIIPAFISKGDLSRMKNGETLAPFSSQRKNAFEKQNG